MIGYGDVHLSKNYSNADTDATGALYFANQLQIAEEAFEAFLEKRQISVGKMIRQGDFSLPIVHAEADFFAPIFLGDQLEVELVIRNVGTTSLTVATTFFKDKERVGSVVIVHVAVKDNKKISIPKMILVEQ